jgi:hypothetical protein
MLLMSRSITYFGVYEPEAFSCLVLGQAFLDEVLNNLLSHPNTSAASSHKYSTLILDWNPSALQCVDNTS